jgi:hypothetical protein
VCTEAFFLFFSPDHDDGKEFVLLNGGPVSSKLAMVPLFIKLLYK